ncbi:cupin domain-containing protein [Lentzea sp. JNUCC 0626]|uniref:AraC family transcriptional regulator n=1 Tax=Lentzea sp. JNUCC 0626 TaxID=3367513 RepID=UPI0037490AF6
MDSISRLLRMARVGAELDRRCLLAGATRMDVAGVAETQAPFHVLLEGECAFAVGGTSLHLRAGDVVIVPSGAPHRVTTPGRGRERGVESSTGGVLIQTRTAGDVDPPVIDLFCGHYEFGTGAGRLLFRSLPDPVHVSFGRTEEGDEVLRMISALMRREAGRDGEGTAAILASLATVLLAMVLRTSRGDATKAALWTAAADRRIAGAVEAMLRSPGEAWTIDRLSRAANTSRATFQRHFTRHTGTTVAAFLARARLMAAAELLGSSDATVGAVALRVGYQSESAFSRAFRAEVGTTPARFRREQAGRSRGTGFPR